MHFTFTALDLASHAGLFRGARISSVGEGRNTSSPNPAWEATLDHVNEILKKMNKRCVLVWSGASLFVGGEDYARRGSFCNKMTRFATIHVTAESSGCFRVILGCLALARMSRGLLK